MSSCIGFFVLNRFHSHDIPSGIKGEFRSFCFLDNFIPLMLFPCIVWNFFVSRFLLLYSPSFLELNAKLSTVLLRIMETSGNTPVQEDRKVERLSSTRLCILTHSSLSLLTFQEHRTCRYWVIISLHLF